MMAMVFLFGVIVFLISLFFCNFTLNSLQKKLSKTQYMFTAKIRYYLSFSMLFIFGILVGKMVMEKLI